MRVCERGYTFDFAPMTHVLGTNLMCSARLP